jgi:hypothetical protein
MINELNARLEEKEKFMLELHAHNETLKAELEKASYDKADIKEIHKNYMMQLQALINQKLIEAPVAKNHGGDFCNFIFPRFIITHCPLSIA